MDDHRDIDTWVWLTVCFASFVKDYCKYPSLAEYKKWMTENGVSHNLNKIYGEMMTINVSLKTIKPIVAQTNDSIKDWCWDDIIAEMFMGVLHFDNCFAELHMIGSGINPTIGSINNEIIMRMLHVRKVHYYNSPGAADVAKTGPQWMGYIYDPRRRPNFEIEPITAFPKRLDLVIFCSETSSVRILQNVITTYCGIQGGFDGFNATQDLEATEILKNAFQLCPSPVPLKRYPTAGSIDDECVEMYVKEMEMDQ